MGERYLLGVDIGTGSSKGVLTTLQGRVAALSEQVHGLSLPQPGWAELDAEAVWWRDFVAICAELVPLAAGGEIAGVGVSGIGPCIVPADQGGRPLRPAILYGIDTRSMAESSVVEPDPAARSTYDPFYAAYRQLHRATVDLQHTMAGLQRPATSDAGAGHG